VQEALTNCVRHAEASWASVQLRRLPGGIDLKVEDNGRGMDTLRQRSEGHGLAGIRERVDLLGGSFALLSGPEGGVTIRVHLPVAAGQSA
jgi:two-component system sensor histidine kinase UhpB